MSAFIVDKAHIDLLVAAGLDFPTHGALAWYTRDERAHRLNGVNADEVGAMLWAENLASVAARYPDDASGERPGPIDLTDDDIAAYRWENVPGRIDPIVVMKAIDCYEYQSCEHAGWRDSAAAAFCDRLRRAAISRLPGYEDAAGWEFSNRRHFVEEFHARLAGATSAHYGN
jgi:hypothetical protein